jgi:methylase of polypeptide subunit release factors
VTKTVESEWLAEPFRTGTSDQFARVRDLLLRSGYTEPSLCARASVTHINEFAKGDARSVLREANDPLSLLVHLFYDERSVPWSVVRSILSPEDLDALTALELVLPDREDPDRCTGSVLLYPTNELHIVSDRDVNPNATSQKLPADVVYPAITANTRRFLSLMPRTPCDDLLDLCSGTGIGALVAANQFARRACAADITERSTRFARFNAALNGLPNVEAVQGDVYEPVEGRTFDRIIAHPPYVPTLEAEYVFRDGGEDGEQVTRKIITGLPKHLRPGGQFYCECLMTERQNAPLEDRLRGMLGEHGDEFDVVIVQVKSIDPVNYLAERLRSGARSVEDAMKEQAVFRRLEVTHLLHASILLRRRSQDRPVSTARRRLSALTTPEDVQWLLRWNTAVAGWDPARERRLLESRPRTLPRTELQARSRLQDGQWALEGCTLTTHSPFEVQADCPNWFLSLLMWCDGRLTARDHFQHLKDTGMVSDEVPEEEFAGMIRQLVDAGVIEIEEFPLPNSTALRPEKTEAVARAD